MVKTMRFKNSVYLGDPINAVKIFNEKEVDEIVVLDISASRQKKGPDFNLIGEIAGECFMPLTYGGGINHVEDIRKLFSIGVEKVCINQSAMQNFDLINEASRIFGSQSVVLSVDIKYGFLGSPKVYDHVKKHNSDLNPIEYIKEGERSGAGEIFVNYVDRDGVMEGYDIVHLSKIVESTSLPIIASGGAGKLEDIKELFSTTEVSAAAAGSMFVFSGKHRAVLITYPGPHEVLSVI